MTTKKLRMNQAIALALADEMRDDPTVVLLGEDIAAAGGPFKTSDGLLEEFGPSRVRDSSISEMGFLGIAVGAAACGLKPVAEIMFIEFLGVALDQLSTEAAKFRYLSRGQYPSPLVVRASVGAGLGFGSQHSQVLETWLYATPGIKVAIPSGAATAYGLLRAAIRDPDPVVVLEPRVLYSRREPVVTGREGILALGQAATVRPGSDVTVVTTGRMVSESGAAAEQAAADMELIDLRTLVPWDRDHVLSSVARTGRCVIVEEGPASGGWGTEIASYVAAHAFDHLRAPVHRVTAPDVPVPFTAPLEARYLPTAPYIAEQVDALVREGSLPVPWWQSQEGAA